MKIKVLKKELADKLNVAAAVTDSKQGDIFGSVLFESKDGQVEITGCTYQSSASGKLEAEADGDGGFTVPAEYLKKLIAKLDGETEITFSLGARQRVTISFEGGRYTITSFKKEEFPKFESPVQKGSLTVDAKAFIDALKVVENVTAKDNTEIAIIKGVNFKPVQGSLEMAAIDGYRLSRDSVPLLASEGEPAFTAQPKYFRPLGKMKPEAGQEITLVVSNATVRAEFGPYAFFVRLLDGDFIEYESIIPESQPAATVRTDAGAMLGQVERASLSVEGNDPVVIDIEPGVMRISTQPNMAGQQSVSESETDAQGQAHIGFNPIFLKNALGHFKGEVGIKFYTSVQPVIITQEGSNILDVVLPIRLND